MKKITNKDERGITLIALVITIIILLILAGVAISMLSGENGIFTKVQYAAQEQERANIQDLTIAGYYYELIAATETFQYLDMEKTAQGIYTNLTNNGYKLKDASGIEITNADKLLSENKEFISLNVKGNHGDYKGEVTNKGLREDIEIVTPADNDEPIHPGQDEPVENDFEIEVKQYLQGSPVTESRIDIKPIIPESWNERDFTEDEAAHLVGNYMKLKNLDGTDITNLKELIIAAANAEYSSYVGAFAKDKYEDMIAVMTPIVGSSVDISTPQKAFLFMMNQTGKSYATVQEYASDIYKYEPTTKSIQIRKVNNDEWTDITPVYGNNASYVVTSNKTYEIKIELDDKMSKTTIEVTGIEQETFKNEEVLKALGITNYTGTYTGTWTKIGEENGKTKLVSTNDVARYMLGNTDKRATDPKIEGSLEEGASELDIAIWSYKNAVNTLNTVAEEATGITMESTGGETTARSINVSDLEKITTIDTSQWHGQAYTYNYTNTKDCILITEEGETVKIDSEEKEVVLKSNMYYDRLTKDEIGILATGGYWLATPNIGCSDTYVSYRFHTMSNGELNAIHYLYQSSGFSDYQISGVRAIVLISNL